MALNTSFLFSKNVAEFSQTNNLPSSLFFLNDDHDIKSIPPHIHQWIASQQDKHLKDQQTLSYPNQPPHSLEKEKPSIHFLCYLKENEQSSVQINDHLLNLEKTTDTVFVQNFIYLDKNSCLDWYENNFSNNNTKMKNMKITTFIFVGEGASLHSFRLNQDEKNEPFSSEVFCELEKKSSFYSLDINFSSSIRKMNILSKGEANFSIIKGLNILQHNQKAHQQVFHTHEGEKGYSRHDYRNALTGRAKNHTHSKVLIKAQKVDSNQMIRNFILSPYAKATNLPDLQVNKDQVKATHGTTIGHPNPMEVFYLNSRGLSTPFALKLVVSGWVEEIFHFKSNKELVPDSFFKFCNNILNIVSPLLKDKLIEILSHKNISTLQL